MIRHLVLNRAKHSSVLRVTLQLFHSKVSCRKIGSLKMMSTQAQPSSITAAVLTALLREQKEYLKSRGWRYLHERTAKFAALCAQSKRLKQSMKDGTSGRVVQAKNYFKNRGLEYLSQRRIRRKEIWKGRREFLEKQSERTRAYLAEKKLQMHRMRVWTIPNLLTMGRMATCPAIGWLVLDGQYDRALAASALMGATDWLDGYIARNYDQQSLLGSFLDPLADKVFMGTLGGTMAWVGLLPWQLALLMLGRDVGLVTGMVLRRNRTRKEGEPFFDLQSVNFEINPSLLSKVNTGLQMAIVALALTKPVFGYPSPEIFDYLCWGVGTTTVMSGASYLGAAGIKPMKRFVDLQQAKRKFSPSSGHTSSGSNTRS